MGRDTEVGHLSDCNYARSGSCTCPTERNVEHPRTFDEGCLRPPAGKKLDAGKAPLFQGVLTYFPRALKAVAGVSAYGLAKYKLEYADKNWMRVENGYGRYSDALVRHTTESAFGKYDAESGLLHDAQAAWNALARLELLMLQLEDQEIANQKKGLEI